MIQDMCCRETWVGGGGGVGMHRTTRATPILPDKSIISLQSGCFYKVESGLKSNGVRASWFMVAEDCGTCWTNSVAEGTDWWSFRKQTNMRDWEKKKNSRSACPAGRAAAALLWTFEHSTFTSPASKSNSSDKALLSLLRKLFFFYRNLN